MADPHDQDAIGTQPCAPFSLREDARELARGTILGGRWELHAEIGRGSSGRVFRAFDRATREAVAVKVFDPQHVDLGWLAQLGRELRLARQIAHPNVCRVFDLAECDGHRLLTMALAEGGSLRRTLQEAGAARPVADRLADARALVSGIAAMHAAGVLHRDIKPENLLRMADGQLVVSDFGLAALAERSTHATRGVGTPLYMAPEVAAGGAATKRSDVFSIGLVLHEIFFGQRLQRDASGRATPIPQPSTPHAAVERAMRALSLRCAATDARDRPASAGDVGRLLDAIARGRTLRGRLHLRRRTLAGAAIAVSLAAVAVVLLVTRRGPGRAGMHTPPVLQVDGTPSDWTSGARRVATLPSPVHCLLPLPDGRVGAIAGEPRQALSIDATSGGVKPWSLPPATYAAPPWDWPDPPHAHCPSIARDGGILYVGHDPSGAEAVFLSRPGQRDRLLTAGDLPVWGPQRDVLALRVDDRHVGVFDVGQGRLVMLPEVAAYAVVLEIAFEPDGRALVVRYADLRAGHALARFDLENGHITHRVHSGAITDGLVRLRLSAAGHQTALVATMDRSGVYRMARHDLESGRARWLGFAPGADVLAAVTVAPGTAVFVAERPLTVVEAWHQGRRIRTVELPYRVYAADADARGNLAVQYEADRRVQVHYVPLSGPTRRVTGGSNDTAPAFTDGGRSLMMSSSEPQGDAIVHCVVATGSCRRVATPGTADWPRPSPDGTRVAYVGYAPTQSVRVLTVGTGETVAISGTRSCEAVWGANDRLWVVKENGPDARWEELTVPELRPTGRTVAVRAGCAAVDGGPDGALAPRAVIRRQSEAALWVRRDLGGW